MRPFKVSTLLLLALPFLAPLDAGAQLTSVGQWGSFGSGPGQFYYPLGIAVAPDGSVFVSDGHQYRIQKFTAHGQYLLEWTVLDRAGNPTRCNRPRVSADGLVYVGNIDDRSIHVYSATGALLRRWGMPGHSPGQLVHPIDIVFAPDGDLLVSDYDLKRILRFHPDSTFVGEFGSTGTGPGQFLGPHGLAVDADGDVYVTDHPNNRVEKFSPGGSFLLQWGSQGRADGQFDSPTGIAVDHDGKVFVVDGFNNRIQSFSENGRFLFTFGSRGPGPGQMEYPVGVAIGPDGTIYVLEQQNHRVQMLRDLTTPAANATWGGVKALYR